MRKKNAFTMFEIGLVFVILTVLVGVSIRIAKAKYDSINSYLYYAAYTILNKTVGEVYQDRQRYSTEATNNASEYSKETKNTYETFSGEASDATEKQIFKICGPLAYFMSSKNENCDNSSAAKALNKMLTQNDFSNDNDVVAYRPDFVAANGMKFYNTNGKIKVSGKTNYILPLNIGTATETDGYIIFVDIDGDRGDSHLWEDIFPFYITTYGKVIPAWKDDTGLSTVSPSTDPGAKSKELLQASVYEFYSNTYPVKSVSYQKAACNAGTIKGDYCDDIEQVTACMTTTDKQADCSVKIIVPIRW